MTYRGKHLLHKCSDETHKKCENSALCHLCDGVKLYKNTSEEQAAKRQAKAERKEAEKNAIVKTHKKEKKEGMAFEKEVVRQWNSYMNKGKKKDDEPILKVGNKKQKHGKPRINLGAIMDESSNEVQEEQVERSYMPGKGLFSKPAPVTLPPRPEKSKPTYERKEARRQANSGAMWHSKGDIVLDHALLECKERGTVSARGVKQITIPKDWLIKQEKEAFQEQKPYWYLPFHYKGDDKIYLVKPFEHEMEIIFQLRQARERIEELEKENALLKGEKS